MTDPHTAQITARPQLLALSDLIEITALSRATIYRRIGAGDFPQPIRIGGTNRWPLEEITGYIEDRKAARAQATV